MSNKVEKIQSLVQNLKHQTTSDDVNQLRASEKTLEEIVLCMQEVFEDENKNQEDLIGLMASMDQVCEALAGEKVNIRMRMENLLRSIKTQESYNK